MSYGQRAYLRVLLAAVTATLAATAVKAAPALNFLHTFTSGMDGANPRSAFVQATDGNFYGTTVGGGASSLGTIFRMTPAGTVTILHAFAGGTDGAAPYAALIQATDGNFYGTTAFGGAFGLGTVFRMMPDGTLTILHAFASGTDGAGPYAALIQATDGNFYGTTTYGGAFLGGTIFQMTPSGTVTILHQFVGNGSADGAFPESPLIQATDGNFYGTTTGGGRLSAGAVFRMTPDGTVTTLHEFAGGTNGAHPRTALVQGTDGDFYGTTYDGGFPTCSVQLPPPVVECGTVFKMTPDGTATILHAFIGFSEGFNPGALIQAPDGNFYGTTALGGGPCPPFPAVPREFLPRWCGRGTVFRMTPNGTIFILHRFADGFDATGRPGPLIQGTDGDFYGMTFGGTTGGAASVWGVAFRLTRRVVESDFDGDGTSDVAVFRPSNSTWYILQSQTSSLSAVPWGASGDIPVPGDYDGDGRTDLAVYRPGTGTWFILQSSTGTFSTVAWGNTGDLPVPADFDGDGRTDFAVYRPSTGTWFILQSSTGTIATVGWGTSEDRPVPADYDGDGRTDLAVYRPNTGQWFILQSSTGTLSAVGWGTSGDLPVPADFDGDGRTDLAVYRPSTGQWFILQSSAGTLVTVQWGTSGDLPVPADFDGDGKTDLAVYRHSTGTWFIFRSSTSTLSMVQWGDKTADDVPILERH